MPAAETPSPLPSPASGRGGTGSLSPDEGEGGGEGAGPSTLDHAGIEQRIPHRGRMCLLDRLESWSEHAIHCTATSHADPLNPLRSAGGLLAACAIEYGAQAMALHGALLAQASQRQRPGVLASVRGVRLAVQRLDDIDGALEVRASRIAGDARQILYRFSVSDGRGALIAEGRATVVLDAEDGR